MSDWNELIDMETKELWLKQDSAFKKSLLEKLNIPTSLSLYNWDQLALKQRTAIGTFSMQNGYISSKMMGNPIYIGDIVYVLSKDYVIGTIKDITKIDFQIFDYDKRDKHFQVHYKDDSKKDQQIWIPESVLKLKYTYNFWVLINKLKERTPEEIALRNSLLSDDRWGW